MTQQTQQTQTRFRTMTDAQLAQLDIDAFETAQNRPLQTRQLERIDAAAQRQAQHAATRRTTDKRATFASAQRAALVVSSYKQQLEELRAALRLNNNNSFSLEFDIVDTQRTIADLERIANRQQRPPVQTERKRLLQQQRAARLARDTA